MKFEDLKQLMLSHSQKVDLPLRYKKDIDYDFEVLERYGNIRYLWLLRASGMLLMPIGMGVSPMYMKFYLENDSSSQFFIVDFSVENKFEQIKNSEVMQYIEKLPCDLKSCRSREEVIDKVTKVLSDDALRFSGFYRLPVPNDFLHWDKWKEFFKISNPLMDKFMSLALSRLASLS